MQNPLKELNIHLYFKQGHYIFLPTFLQKKCLVLMCSVSQPWVTLCDPMDCSLPGFSVHGIFQASVLEWVAISFSWSVNVLTSNFVVKSDF